MKRRRTQRQMQGDELAEALRGKLEVVMKAGPLRNGCQRGHGSVWHLAPAPHYAGLKALCGAAPSIQWSQTWRDDQTVTCPKCLCLSSRNESQPSMRTYQVELAGTITRDIIWRELDAKDEAEAKAIVASEMPTYRLRAIWLKDSSAPCSSNSASPNGSAGS